MTMSVVAVRMKTVYIIVASIGLVLIVGLGLTVAVLISTGRFEQPVPTITSQPTISQPTKQDRAISELRNQESRFIYMDDNLIIDSFNLTCRYLETKGADSSAFDGAYKIARDSGFTASESGALIAWSVIGTCPQYSQPLNDWAKK